MTTIDKKKLIIIFCLIKFEKYYNISYDIVSYTFLLGFTGYLLAAFTSEFIHRFVGRWGTVTLGGLLQTCCYINAFLKPHFALLVVGYSISGFGNGLLEASLNAWAGNLNNNNEMLGLLHGFYGLGGILSPSIATKLLLKGYQWNELYLYLMSVSICSSILAFYAFSGDTAQKYNEDYAKSMQRHYENSSTSEDDETTQLISDNNNNNNNIQENIVNSHVTDTLLEMDAAAAIEKSTHGNMSALEATISSPLAIVISLALFVYVAAETTVGGWIVTFMIDVRHGDEKAMGYASTAYWMGMTVGRMGLSFITGRGSKEELFFLAYTVLSLIATLVFWLVPSLEVSMICSPLIGFFTAPLYPTAMVVFLRKFPEHLHVVGVGFLAASGGVGGALGPFINGVLTEKFGAYVLGPFTTALLASVLGLWIVVMVRF